MDRSEDLPFSVPWGLCRAALAVWGKTQEGAGAVEFRVTAEPVLRVLVKALRNELGRADWIVLSRSRFTV